MAEEKVTEQEFPFVPYSHEEYEEADMISRSKEFLDWMEKRRSVRDFSDRPVPREVMENIILAASTAPSGAHKQPWTFCLVSNEELKHKIRELAEEEERKSYEGRMSEQWLKDLAPLGTNWEKAFLDVVPWHILMLKRVYEYGENGEKLNNYYVNESVGIAAGMLLTAIHHAGLVALTHTPSPMNFLAKVLDRPENERPFLLIPVGYAAEDATVPDLKRKSLDDIMVHYG